MSRGMHALLGKRKKKAQPPSVTWTVGLIPGKRPDRSPNGMPRMRLGHIQSLKQAQGCVYINILGMP